MKKLYTLLFALVAVLAVNAQNYYLIGGFNNWTLADESCKFKAAGDGTYVLDYAGTLTTGFKLNNGTWSDDNNNFGSNGSKLVIGQPYTVAVGGSTGNIAMDGNIEKPHIVFNPATKVLLITGQEVEAEYKYGIHGSIFAEGEDWTTFDMAENEDGTWTLTTSCYTGNFGIKQMDAKSGAQTNWIYSSAENTTVVLNTPMGTVIEDGGNGANLWLCDVQDGDYTFVFDPKGQTLTITFESGVADITGGAEAPVYYNLQGVRVDNPAGGLYIERRGDSVRKVLVR